MKVLVPQKHNEILISDVKFGIPFWHKGDLYIKVNIENCPDHYMGCVLLSSGKFNYISESSIVTMDDNICVTELQSEERINREINIECRARELAEKLHKISDNESFKGVFGFAANHGYSYSGPTFEMELKNLESSLSE